MRSRTSCSVTEKMKKTEKVCTGFVYMLQCSDGSLYTGWTTDIDRRVRMHNEGRGARYTRSRRPVKPVYLEPAVSREEALRREAAIKKLSRKDKLKLIDSEQNAVEVYRRIGNDHSEDGIRDT